MPAALLRALEDRTRLAQQELAQRTDAGDDVLAYLAEHGGVTTRRAVAANLAAPRSANLRLCDDEEEDVRGELARKIARLLPDISPNEASSLRDHCVELLEKLANDQAPRVRGMLAEEIKRLACVPKSVVDRLAHDVEEIVSTPILEYSPLLSDADLIEIIAGAQVERVLTAIARRQPLGADVSDAVVGSLDIPVLATLLANPKATVRTETLYRIAVSAEKISALHELLVLRSDLSVRTIRRLATFVGTKLLEMLADRHNLDEATSEIIHRRLQERLQKDSENDTDAAARLPARMRDAIDEETVEIAVRRGDKVAVVRALATLTEVPPDTIRCAFEARAPHAMIALVWKAGLSMRLAYHIQVFVMHLAPSDRVAARNGKYFPFTKEEMAWQLGILGVLPPTGQA
ncbi:MAG: DUF2336 domain-containing protein [Alphaproteobacteria bacterium]|nr:DUF2336 domain-containing protein [Alphaproteobacteria bacterium]